MNSQRIIDIKQEYLLPITFRIAGVFMIIGGCVVLSNFYFAWFKVVIGLAMAILGAAIASARYGLEVDMDKKQYRIYTQVIGYKTGKATAFHSIEKFYINEVLETQRMYSRAGAMRDQKSYIYKSYMKLDNGDKVHLGTANQLEKMEGKLDEWRGVLGV